MRKFLISGLLGFAFVSQAFAHCEIPCGIYNDEMRFDMLEEHITTMEKSISEIKELYNKEDVLSKNQLTRWIMNKDKHATEFQHILWQYFLTQRIKPVSPDNPKAYKNYLRKLELIHRMTHNAMKVKQTVDYKYTTRLRKLLKEFEDIYYKEHGHKHKK